MKKVIFLLTLAFGVLIISCEKDEIINESSQQQGELKEQDIGVLPPGISNSAKSLDTIRIAEGSVQNRSSWTYLADWSFTSSTGYHYLAWASKSYLEQYDVKAVVSPSNYTGAVTGHGYSPFRMIGWQYAYPNASTPLVLTRDDLHSSETRGYFHTFSWTNNTTYSVTFYRRPKSNTPPGWDLIQSDNGVNLFKKDYQSGYPDYVQEVDLTKASIVFHQGNNASASPSNPSPGLNKRNFHTGSNSFWNTYGGSAFSIVNAAFFNGTTSESAFPIKHNGTIISAGYGNHEPLPMRKLEINGTTANVMSYTNNSNNYNTVATNLGSVPTVMVGLHPLDANKSKYSPVGRTFIGLPSSNSNKVYIFCSGYSTQVEAYNVLKNEFDCSGSEIVMFDGGGSSQMTCNGTNYVNSSDNPDRRIPSIIAVY